MNPWTILWSFSSCSTMQFSLIARYLLKTKQHILFNYKVMRKALKRTFPIEHCYSWFELCAGNNIGFSSRRHHMCISEGILVSSKFFFFLKKKISIETKHKLYHWSRNMNLNSSRSFTNKQIIIRQIQSSSI